MSQPIKAKEWWIPSVDKEAAKLCYRTEAEALKYAMKKSSMSCGAIHVVEAKPVLERIKSLEAKIESKRFDEYEKQLETALGKDYRRAQKVIEVMRETLTNIATCTRLDGSVMAYKSLPKEAIEALEKADEILKGGCDE